MNNTISHDFVIFCIRQQHVEVKKRSFFDDFGFQFPAADIDVDLGAEL